MSPVLFNSTKFKFAPVFKTSKCVLMVEKICQNHLISFKISVLLQVYDSGFIIIT